eukprot:1159369-Pelagomonas_calceolata.AAC.4
MPPFGARISHVRYSIHDVDVRDVDSPSCDDGCGCALLSSAGKRQQSAHLLQRMPHVNALHNNLYAMYFTFFSCKEAGAWYLHAKLANPTQPVQDTLHFQTARMGERFGRKWDTGDAGQKR